MVIVLKQNTDWAELDIERRALEDLRYLVRLEEDPTRSYPGLAIGQQSYRLVALIEEQGVVILDAYQAGKEPDQCPEHLQYKDVDDGGSEISLSGLRRLLTSVFHRN